MKSLRRLVEIFALVLGLASQAQAQLATQAAAGSDLKLQVIAPEKAPKHASFWSLQRLNFPPLPFNPFPELPLYSLQGASNSYVYDDAAIDYQAIYKKQAEAQALRQFDWESGLLSDAEFFSLEGGSSSITISSYSENDLWIELLAVTNDNAYLRLHGTVEGEGYQLLSKTNLAQAGEWKLGEIITGAPSTNQTDFTPLYVADDTNQIFLAHHANPIVSVATTVTDGFESNALIPASQSGSFYIICNYSNAVTVYYQMSGVASNGGDYTNLTGIVTIPAFAGSAPVEVHPKADTLVEGGESVVLTLVQTNTYLIQPASASATLTIWDASTSVRLYQYHDAVETNGPPGSASELGSFYFQRWDERGITPAMTVHYTVSGTASNGVDYPLLNGVLSLTNGETLKYLDLNPTDDNLAEGVETLKLTLTPTNTYLLDTDTNANTQAITITDSTTTVGVTPDGGAVEPHPASNTSKETGKFLIFRSDSRLESPALTISYQLSGTATNGNDYTNLNGTVTFQVGQAFTNVFIEPLFDGQLEGNETVTLTLTHVGDGYLITSDTNYASATIALTDNIATNTFQTVALMSAAVGIDYHQPTNALIVSGGFNGFNFARVYTNTVSSNVVSVITNWSRISGVPDEVKLVTVKTTGNGFTNGETFFGSGTGIGWLSANGTSSNLNWCVLTNSVQTNALLLRGSLCMDETGTFSNELVAVTSSGGFVNEPKGVWRVGANQIPTLIASIDTEHLEGVTVLTNDVAKWGPWAGKIITGDEDSTPPRIYTIAANGAVATNDTTTLFPSGIHPEDFDIIPANQDLYACDPNGLGSLVVKVSRDYFTNYVGQLLITDAGEVGSNYAKLYAVRWDAGTTNFVVKNILNYSRTFEHVTFAPVNLPPLNP